MRIEDVKKGMRIIINNSFDKTNKKFCSCKEMHQMKGRMFIIDSIDKPANCIMINNYSWDAHDVSPVVIPEEEPIIFNFNIKNLSL